jgi:regulator of protease activity HflC (stomatin/prohibitin superfamily)
MRRPGLAHVASVRRQFPMLWMSSGFFLLAGAICVWVALARAGTLFTQAAIGEQTRAALGAVGAACIVAATGMLAAFLVALARLRLDRCDRLAEALQRDPPSGSDGRIASSAIEGLIREAGRIAAWPQAVVVGLLGLAAAGTVAAVSPRIMATDMPAPTDLGPALILLLLAFPVLVLERSLARKPPAEFPNGEGLARLMRVPLAALLAAGVAAALQARGFVWAAAIDAAAAVIVFMVAAELALRAAAMLFVPFPPPDEPRCLAVSSIAGLITLRPPTLDAIGGMVEAQLGIELRRSWALRFLRGATVPLIAGLVILAWAVTGLTSLPLDRRAVYERFGVPVAVFGPGLHLHLPWPFGLLRPVEYGATHDVAVTLANAGTSVARASIDAEAPPLPEMDRLWEDVHPSEATYLVASGAGAQQNFQVVDIDLRLIYRVGLTDADAIAAVTNDADPDALVRAVASRIIGRYLASQTVLSVLGKNLATLSTQFRDALQHELTALHTGLDVTAVVVEAIHPPTGAASAYHAVQTAEISAQVAVAEARSAAADTKGVASQQAATLMARAGAAAAETIDAADADSIRFAADRQADEQNGQGFLLERWLDHVAKALQGKSILVIDNRLIGTDLPTIDLRNLASPAVDAAPAQQQ